MRQNTDWIIAHDATKGEDAYAMECLRCGAKQRVALPISVDGYLALSRLFVREHGKCTERRESGTVHVESGA